MAKKRTVWIVLGIILGLIFLLAVSFGGILILSRFSDFSGISKITTSEAPSKGVAGYGVSEAPSLSPTVLGTREKAAGEAKTGEVSTTGPTTAAGGEKLAEQKVIKTANLTLLVEKVGDAISEINSLAVSKGGFILSSSVTTNPDETQSASVTLKVPVTKFEEVVSEAKKLAKKVELEKVYGQDVTEEYTDLQSQLKNYRAEEAQYLEILKKATTIDDILKVTERLSLVRGQIEMTEGRIKYLESQTDMSTITLTLKEETRLEIPTKEWRPLTTLKLAFRAWVRLLQWLVNVLIWFTIFVLPPIILIWLVVKIFKWKRRKKQETIEK